jgi:hypothetical protein
MKNRQGHKPFNLFGRLQIVQTVIARPEFKMTGAITTGGKAASRPELFKSRGPLKALQTQFA